MIAGARDAAVRGRARGGLPRRQRGRCGPAPADSPRRATESASRSLILEWVLGPVAGQEADVFGCTDASATNYDQSATVDDGSCEYGGGIPTVPPTTGDVYGCMDDTAMNFNPDATVDDGSCEFTTATEPHAGGDDPACVDVNCAVNGELYPQCCGMDDPCADVDCTVADADPACCDPACTDVDCAVDGELYPQCCGELPPDEPCMNVDCTVADADPACCGGCSSDSDCDQAATEYCDLSTQTCQ
eukprot:COSAG04_NODE_6252_length_1373_cov_1.079278_1_plen_244_part_10